MMIYQDVPVKSVSDQISDLLFNPHQRFVTVPLSKKKLPPRLNLLRQSQKKTHFPIASPTFRGCRFIKFEDSGLQTRPCLVVTEVSGSHHNNQQNQECFKPPTPSWEWKYIKAGTTYSWRTRLGGCCQPGDSTQVFPLHYLFSILGVVWPSLVMRTGVTVCLESWGNASPPCPRISAQAPYTAAVCSDFTWTVKVKPCWHICASLPEANSYYICLLFSGRRGSRQESNALLEWLTADSELTASPQWERPCWFFSSVW